MSIETRRAERKRRQVRARKKINGTADRPRLSVFRSHQHIYAQIIDDVQGHTLVAASSVEPDVKTQGEYFGNIEGAKVVGSRIAKKALELGITQVVFDRGGNKYHGRVAALAEAARENGLSF
ncbi:50S ribosomal protein L18 [bacterium (Candidatus Blackallbacteria) CG17_big_fil_post_rev_8_21_14_2_50_48_46]|uniref:Large ribosomal subunit protein uL18 n=1 Tax=bacterium (Candidatus Blackallbacteria) CG17_big_fil_post_rev_8_21_14_2_50_48_46 TaxID=2014261 RepID=A0A2M7G1K2_9BACT|nr:MAG: 50S ribosomal protein L18 [bacterium (Candidatus Blackallbacteria) CG18_big_fil_WC_8_21_14_2_50_49_26]PIW15407.1 MAG: 50S ribosomal protein L18 [bacterium (Candidatus Blackallbacteria) CG17_big_fil_post_rev_8_21_14_2_50_48_46]PIW49732.1 MAG: 50S ribosomal protein L18 [bacterium (Candidatus Blackallbacteria) CG13_big_fil_rev_8_21_14_2_50_49_14]